MIKIILVFNAGSSSLKYKLFDRKKQIIHGLVDRIGSKGYLEYEYGNSKIKKKVSIKNHSQAVELALNTLIECNVSLNKIKLIGHRFVHGGNISNASVIDSGMIKQLKQLSELAPLHNPPSLECVLACKKHLNKKQIAVFDTSFHQTIPSKACLYGIPYKFYKKYNIKKYGFHGISHKYVALKASKLLNNKNLKIISCHLGNGSSITAIKNNKSMDTSMGFTPNEGLIMGTRSGDIDPEIIPYLMKKEGLSVNQVIKTLNLESGFKGLCGYSDLRDVLKLVKKNKNARLALDMLVYEITKYIGSYFTVLKGIDALIFTGGIGEHIPILRKRVCDNLKFLGISINNKKNNNNELIISNGKVKVMVIPTDEELMIARECSKF